MRKLLLSSLLIICCAQLSAQAFVKGTGVRYDRGVPTVAPDTTYGTELVYDLTNRVLYMWDRTNEVWVKQLNVTRAAGAPSGDPGNGPDMYVNATTEDLYWWSGSGWDQLNSGGGDVTQAQLDDSTAAIRADFPVSFIVDSTRLIQDSVLVYYQNGSEVGRDTIATILLSGSAITANTVTISAGTNSSTYTFPVAKPDTNYIVTTGVSAVTGSPSSAELTVSISKTVNDITFTAQGTLDVGEEVKVYFMVIDSAGTSTGSDAFISLSDTPGSFSGQANKMVLVNPDADGLIFVDTSGWGSGGGSVNINAQTVYLADTNLIEKRSSGPSRSDMPSIVQYSKDTLYLVYQRATGGSGDDADFVLDARFSYDGGLTWEDKTTIYTETDVGANNGIGYPHLFWDENSDTTHLVFFARESTAPNDDSEFWHAHSLDHGQTWTGLVQITPGDDEYYVSASHRLIKLSDGRLAIPVGKQQGEGDNAAKKIAIFYSDDAGQTWTIDSTEITSPTNFGEATEPGLIQFENDSLLLYYRTKTGSIYYTTSGNVGVDWQPERSLGIFSGDNMATMAYDPRKRVLYMTSSPPNRAFTGAYVPSTFDDRQIIILQSSYDFGKSWSDGKIVGSHEEEVVQVFEPNIHIDTFNNNLHVLYSENGDRISLKQKIFSTEALMDDIPSYKYNELYANRISLGRDSFAYTLRPPSILEVFEPYRDNPNVNWLKLGNHIGGISAFNIGNDGANVRPWIYYSSNVYNEGMGNRVTWRQSTGQTFSPMFRWEFGYNSGSTAPSANQILMDWRPLGGSTVMQIDNEGDLTLAGEITLTNGWKTLTFAPTSAAHGVFMPSTGTGGLDIKFGTIDATDTWPWIHMKPDGNNRYGWFMGSKNTSHTATSTTIPAVRFEAVSTITGTERNALDPTSLMFDWSNDGTIVQRLFANGDLDMITGDLDIQAGGLNVETGDITGNILINDTGSLYDSTNVEGVLVEIQDWGRNNVFFVATTSTVNVVKGLNSIIIDGALGPTVTISTTNLRAGDEVKVYCSGGSSTLDSSTGNFIRPSVGTSEATIPIDAASYVLVWDGSNFYKMN